VTKDRDDFITEQLAKMDNEYDSDSDAGPDYDGDDDGGATGDSEEDP
jgi:hypothetical protein